MKPRILPFLIVAAAALVLLISYLVRPNPQSSHPSPVLDGIAEQPNTPPGTPVKSVVRPAAGLQKPERDNAPLEQPNWMLEPLPPGPNLHERLEEFARQKGVPLNILTQQAATQFSNAISKNLNRVIEFYGKVVDENGLPIPRANVEFSVVVFPEEQFQTNRLSDSNGMFALNNIMGAALMVQVSKESYEEIQGTNQNKFIYQGAGPRFAFRPDSNNPVVFHLRKKTN